MVQPPFEIFLVPTWLRVPIWSGTQGQGKVIFSKSFLDIGTRLVVTVETKTKWTPNSDSTSKLMPTCKILGQYDLPNYFLSCLKIAVF